MEKNFIRVRSTKDIIVFTSLIIIGGILAAIPDADGVNLGGYTLIVIGIILAFLQKGAYKDVDTKELYFRKDFSFLGEMKTAILSALDSSPESIPLAEEGKGQTLILRMYYGKTSGKAYLQLFEYIPHQYNPCTDIYEFEISKVNKLIR